MRIISGTARNRRIEAPEGRNTRPTLDRVRENLFNILQTRTPSSVVLDLEPGFAARTGLPEGHSEGKYDFIQDLPPHGHVSVRYDTAHNLDITIGEGEERIFVSLDIGYAAEDGSTASVYVGAVTEDSIPILLTDEGFETVLFRKTGQGS